MAARLFQRSVINDVERRRVVASPATLLHDAQELLGNAEEKAAPVVGRIGQETVEAVLPDLSAQQAKPLGLVETEQADVKQADEQKVQKEYRTRNTLLLADMGLAHQLAKAELMTDGNNLLAKTLFFAQNVAQLGNFV